VTSTSSYDHEIDTAVAKLTGRPVKNSPFLFSSRAGDMMPFRVRNVLLVASAYDFFMLEEEGRLSDLLRRDYNQLELGYVPVLTHIVRGARAIELMRDPKTPFDLLVIFNPPRT